MARARTIAVLAVAFLAACEEPAREPAPEPQTPQIVGKTSSAVPLSIEDLEAQFRAMLASRDWVQRVNVRPEGDACNLATVVALNAWTLRDEAARRDDVRAMLVAWSSLQAGTDAYSCATLQVINGRGRKLAEAGWSDGLPSILLR